MKCLHSSEGVMPPLTRPPGSTPWHGGEVTSTATTLNLHPAVYPGVNGENLNPCHQHPKLAAQPTP